MGWWGETHWWVGWIRFDFKLREGKNKFGIDLIILIKSRYGSRYNFIKFV